MSTNCISSVTVLADKWLEWLRERSKRSRIRRLSWSESQPLIPHFHRSILDCSTSHSAKKTPNWWVLEVNEHDLWSTFYRFHRSPHHSLGWRDSHWCMALWCSGVDWIRRLLAEQWKNSSARVSKEKLQDAERQWPVQPPAELVLLGRECRGEEREKLSISQVQIVGQLQRGK